MAKTGVCSECPEAHASPRAKTCSQACRSKRARRLARAKKKSGETRSQPEHMAAIQDEALVREVAREELRPIVREAITEDVLRAAQRLVNLTPRMVECIEEDLQSPDKLLRQKAYSLLARYTLGNTSIAPQPDAPAQTPMQVVFNLPRPGDERPELTELEEVHVEAVELRECAECHVEQPVDVFVANSQRCAGCHDKVLAQVRERFPAAP